VETGGCGLGSAIQGDAGLDPAAACPGRGSRADDPRRYRVGDGDLAIAQKLKDIYPNVATALGSAEAAQLRFNDAARGLSSSIENELVGGLTDIVSGTKSVGQGFSDMAASVVKAIEQMIIKIMIVEPLMRTSLVDKVCQFVKPGTGLTYRFVGPDAIDVTMTLRVYGV
jgi:hypothetical protein